MLFIISLVTAVSLTILIFHGMEIEIIRKKSGVRWFKDYDSFMFQKTYIS